MSAITALQAAAQLEVACLFFLRDEHLLIDRPVCHVFASPAAAGFVCYTAAIRLSATS